MSQKQAEAPPLAPLPLDEMPSLHVTIRTMAGEAFELDLKPTDLPAKIVSHLAEIDSARFVPALQRLMYNGRRIPPNTLKTLSTLGIVDGGAIDLLMNEDASLNSAERTMVR